VQVVAILLMEATPCLRASLLLAAELEAQLLTHEPLLETLVVLAVAVEQANMAAM
jgi:hypothetical protein